MLEPPTNQLINLKKPNNEKLFFLFPSAFVCSQARETESRLGCADLVATLGYDIENNYLWSRIAQNYIFLHNLLKNLIVKHSTQLLFAFFRKCVFCWVECTTIIVISACPISFCTSTIYILIVVVSLKLNCMRSQNSALK